MKLKYKQQGRGIYLLPNLFTTASLFAAYYAIVAAYKHQFELAVIAIFIGMIADGLDGRVARLTNTQTAFGAEYDSLSDMVTFGVAPSLIAYTWALHRFGKIGWLLAFMYTAAVALRLARFNTQVGVVNKRFFQGLACPASAAVLASLIWLAQQQHWQSVMITVVIALTTVLLAVLMVSNIRYYSFKDIDFRGKVPFIYVLLLVLVFIGIALDPALILLLGFGCYALSGPVYTLYRLHNTKRARRKHRLD